VSYDIEMTILGFGSDAARGELVFEALLEMAPGTDPVVSHDLEAGTLRASLSYEAPSDRSAAEQATATLRQAAPELHDADRVVVRRERVRVG